MNVEAEFPCRVYLNLARRQDRRFAALGEFERAGLAGVRRFPAVDGKRLGSAGGFGSEGYHALAIANRMALRRAALQKASAVLMFEDDVVLHPRFRELAAQIELPDDWRCFSLAASMWVRRSRRGGDWCG